MAFYDEEEDQQDPNAQQSVQNPNSSVITGTPGGGGGSTPGAKANAPDRPGNFVNLQSYLSANKSQANKLGDQAAGVINQSADQARQGVSALNQEADEKIKSVGMLGDDVSNKIQTAPETLTPEERQQVKSTKAATYQGPESYVNLNSFQQASDSKQKAQQNIDNSGTEQGRMGLISQINSKPRTQGMNVFDNALLQSGGGREKLSVAANANQDVKTGLDQATEAIQGKIGRADDPSTPDIDESAGAIGQTNKSSADALKKVQDALSGWTSGFQPKVTQAQQNLVDLQNRVQSDIGDNPLQLDDETMQLLGLSRGQRLYNNNLSNYLKPASPTDINAANVATNEDYTRYAALADLAGDQSLLLDPANASKAGTAPKMTADGEKLQGDINQAKSNYDASFKTVGALNNYAGGGTPGYYSENYTPEQIEQEIIPMMLGPLPEWSAPASRQMAAVLKEAIEKWRADQGWNNVVNGFGLDGNMEEEPDVPGHVILKPKI